ncbi:MULTISPECIES: GNAT family N-acetyltransferase [Streptomyces]|nr:MULTISPECIES: GNAT family N-acetyltransferase [Streptomyces]
MTFHVDIDDREVSRMLHVRMGLEGAEIRAMGEEAEAAEDFHQTRERLSFLQRQGVAVRFPEVWDEVGPRAAMLLEESDGAWFMWKGPTGPPDSEVLRRLLAHCAGLPQVTLVLRPEWELPDALAAAGFRPAGTFRTLLVDAAGEDEDVLGRMRASTRSRVRRALRFGFDFADDPGLLPRFHPFYADAMRNANSPDFAPEAYLRELLELPRVHLFGAVHGTEMAAGSVCLVNGDSVEARYVATNPEYRTQAALNFVHFQTMKWAAAQGLRYLDLSGIDGDETSEKTRLINRFKLGFGGTEFSYPVYCR